MFLGLGLALNQPRGLPFPSWVLPAEGQPALLDVDYTTQRYWYNGTSYSTLTAFQAAIGATFTRASAASYRDATGTYQQAAANALRFDHDAAGTPLGILIEGARTNIALNSNGFNTGWQLQSNTIRASAQGTGPDGTNSLWKISRTVTSAGTYFLRSPIGGYAVSASTAYTVSVFAKAGEFNWLYLDNVGGSATDFLAYFDLTNGTTGTTTSCTSAIEDWGNGIYRCSVTFTSAAAQTALTFDIGGTTQNNNPIATVGSIGDGYYIYGVQVEQGSFISSYIATTAAAVTRAADVYTVAAASAKPFVGWNDTEGTFVLDYNHDDARYTNVVSIADASDGPERLELEERDNGTFGFVRTGAVGSAINSPSVSTLFGDLKAAIRYKVGELPRGSRNGGSAFNFGNTAYVAPDFSNSIMSIGRRQYFPTHYFSEPIRRITYFPTGLSDADLVRLST